MFWSETLYADVDTLAWRGYTLQQFPGGDIWSANGNSVRGDSHFQMGRSELTVRTGEKTNAEKTMADLD